MSARTKQGVGTTTKQAEPISEESENMLWNKGLLGALDEIHKIQSSIHLENSDEIHFPLDVLIVLHTAYTTFWEDMVTSPCV
jgi:hypothetical protein